MRAPVPAAGDGALGFWAALREVFPETKEQRDRVHKVANVLDCLPESAQPAARKALAQIRNAEDREHAEKAVKDFATAYGAKYPEATTKITGDQEQLLAFSGFPAGHWVHLKTSNPIESAFATVRLRTRVTKRPGSRAAGLAMVFKLVQAAEGRWRYVNAPHLVALVRAGAKFEKGVLAGRPDEAEMKDAASSIRTRRPQLLTIPRWSSSGKASTTRAVAPSGTHAQTSTTLCGRSVGQHSRQILAVAAGVWFLRLARRARVAHSAVRRRRCGARVAAARPSPSRSAGGRPELVACTYRLDHLAHHRRPGTRARRAWHPDRCPPMVVGPVRRAALSTAALGVGPVTGAGRWTHTARSGLVRNHLGTLAGIAN
jgi:hypothetical protein